MFTRFQDRRREPELMEQPGLDERLHRRALSGLRRINRLSRSSAIFWPALRRLAATDPSRNWRVLDIASGGGDVTIDLAWRAARSGLTFTVEGCDVSPYAVRHAAAQAARRRVERVHFFECDVLAQALPSDYDVILCSLFLHHLDDETAVALLSKMSAAAKALVLVNDLCRTTAGYVLAWVGCRVVTRSPIVRFDGPVSVAAAFSVAEVKKLAHRAGLEGATVDTCWPQRLLMKWEP